MFVYACVYVWKCLCFNSGVTQMHNLLVTYKNLSFSSETWLTDAGSFFHGDIPLHMSTVCVGTCTIAIHNVNQLLVLRSCMC